MEQEIPLQRQVHLSETALRDARVANLAWVSGLMAVAKNDADGSRVTDWLMHNQLSVVAEEAMERLVFVVHSEQP